MIDLEYSCDASRMFIFRTFFIIEEIKKVFYYTKVSGDTCEIVNSGS